VINHKTQIDQRPFQSQSDHAREVALQTHYHNLAIPAVVAALQNCAGSADKLDKKATDKQQR